MARVTLRPATPSDSDFAFRVKRAAFREYVELVWGWDEAEQRRLHERRFEAQDCQIISAAGADVGYIAVVTTPDCVKLNQLFILPEHQSKGIGRECVRLIADEARRAGRPVSLQVLKVNPRALAFYDRLGFLSVGETATHVLMEKACGEA